MSLRVLHVSASFPRSEDDSTAPFLLDLVRAQRHAGWDPHVVAVHDAGLPRRHELAGTPIRRVRYGPDRWEVLAYRGGGHGGLRSPLHVLLLPGLLLAMVSAVRAAVRDLRPDVVHAHWILPGGLVAALLPRRRPRVVLTLHGTDVELAAGRLGVLARWVVGRADGVVAVSEPLARRAEEVLGLAPGSVAVARLPLPEGLDPAPLPDGPRRVLAAGRASPEKGFDVLVAALARAEAGGVAATLIVDGPTRPALEKAVADAGLGERVAFCGLVPRAELFDRMRAHHLVVVPSRTEGLGMLAVEALALGRPVVASAVGGLASVVVDGVDGALVPPDDPAALATAIATVPLLPPLASVADEHRPAAIVAAHAAAYGVVA